MNDRRTGVILHPQITKPAAAPYPVSYDRINQDNEDRTEDDINAKFGAFRHPAASDRERYSRKRHLEQEHQIERYTNFGEYAKGTDIPFAAEQEPGRTQEAVPVAESETEAKQPPSKNGYSQSKDRFAGYVPGVLHPNGTCFK
ncbi:hypothetical protein D3C81_1035660 [compost metagenome]